LKNAAANKAKERGHGNDDDDDGSQGVAGGWHGLRTQWVRGSRIPDHWGWAPTLGSVLNHTKVI